MFSYRPCPRRRGVQSQVGDVLEIRLLGQFDLRRNGEILSLPSRPAQSLLAYLALNPGLSYRREYLAGLLAPDAPEVSARNRLRHALWRIRKSLGPDPGTGRDYLITDEITVAFDAASNYWLDAAVAAARLAPNAPPQALAEVLAAYQGDLLPGFYDDWVVLERERIEAAFEGKMRLWLERQAGAGCWDEVLHWGERWISLGHSPESAYCALMLAHAARSDVSRIALVFQRCVDDLRGGLGVEPADATRRLYEQLMRGEGVPLLAQAQVIALPAQVPVTARPVVDGSGPPPFKGLEPFHVADAHLFFGREELVARLVEHLGRDNLLIVVGASGCGKSSLVRAGLVPALAASKPLDSCDQAAQCTGSPECRILTPTGHPLQSLALALSTTGSVLPAAALVDDMGADSRSLSLYLARREAGIDGVRASTRTLLVVDQFEEVFTLCQDEAERTAFIVNLMRAAVGDGEPRPGLLTLVIALRADFYGHCAAYPSLRRALETSQHYIGEMNAAELRLCIEGPLEVGRWQVEPGLVDLLVRDVGSEPGALPLLSHALLETWRARSGRMLTLEGYAATGGVRGAIARTADSVYDRLSDEKRAVARRIFLRLVAFGDGIQESRRRVARDQLAPDVEGRHLVESVLQSLAAARLITLGKDQVELAHEALIREWPVLHGWLAEDRENLQLHRRLAEAAAAWETSGREAADLYRGVRLAQAAEWAGRHSQELDPAERSFLAASQAEADRLAAEREAQRRRDLDAARQLADTERARAEEQQRSNIQLRRRSLFLTAALLVVLAMSSLAVVLWRRAQQAAEEARVDEALAVSRELSASSAGSLGFDDELAVLLALEAVGVSSEAGVAVPVEAETALHRAIQASPLDKSFAVAGQAAVGAGGNLIIARQGDGSLLAWDRAALGGAEPATEPRYAIPAGTGVFELSPDDRLLAVADAAGGIALYDAGTGVKQRDLRGHGGHVTALRFSGDGSRLVSVGKDAAVRTWNTTTGDELIPLSKPGSEPSLVEISPDGTRVLAGVIDGGVYLWDPVAGRRIAYVIGQEGWPWAMAFCGGAGRFMIGAGASARLWDAATGLHLLTVSIVDRNPSALACSPDGLRFATAAMPTTRIWDVETGQSQRTLSAGNDVVRLSFSSDAARLLVHRASGPAGLWDIQGSRELVTLGTPGGCNDVTFSPDGVLLAAAGDAGVLALWQVGGPGGDADGSAAGAWKLCRRVAGHGNAVTGLAFDPAGGRVATGGLDETIRMWNLPADGAAAEGWSSLHEHTAISGAGEVVDLGFNRDGTRLAVASSSGLRLWDVEPGAAAATHLEEIAIYVPTWMAPVALAWSPDGTRLAAALVNGQARILYPAGQASPIDLFGHSGGVLDVVWSPDGSLLATAGADGIVQLWDGLTPDAKRAGGAAQLREGLTPAAMGAPMYRRARYTLRGHTSAVNAVSFSPDGLLLATAGADGAVQLWDVNTGLLRLTLAKLPAPATGISFSPDGRFLATSGDAVRIFLLRLDDLVLLARQRVSRRLTSEECRQYLHVENEACAQRTE